MAPIHITGLDAGALPANILRHPDVGMPRDKRTTRPQRQARVVLVSQDTNDLLLNSSRSMAKASQPAPEKPKSSPPAEAKKRVLIVDDHPIFRDGIAQLINDQTDLMVCGGVCSAAHALTAVEQCQPDIMVVDISIQGTNGIELMKSIRAQHPALPALMVSMHDENIYAERALRAGARGYIMKHAAPEKVVEAIRRVLSGGLYLSEAIGGRLLDTFLNGRGDSTVGSSAVDKLSDRELEIFRALGEGRGTREIARTLFLSVKTVETHRAHIKEKLKLQTAPELVRAAVEWVNQEANLGAPPPP